MKKTETNIQNLKKDLQLLQEITNSYQTIIPSKFPTGRIGGEFFWREYLMWQFLLTWDVYFVYCYSQEVPRPDLKIPASISKKQIKIRFRHSGNYGLRISLGKLHTEYSIMLLLSSRTRKLEFFFNISAIAFAPCITQ